MPFVLLYLNPCVYMAPLRGYGDNGVTILTFWVTLRHRSRDHSTPGGRLPMGGP